MRVMMRMVMRIVMRMVMRMVMVMMMIILLFCLQGVLPRPRLEQALQAVRSRPRPRSGGLATGRAADNRRQGAKAGGPAAWG